MKIQDKRQVLQTFQNIGYFFSPEFITLLHSQLLSTIGGLGATMTALTAEKFPYLINDMEATTVSVFRLVFIVIFGYVHSEYGSKHPHQTTKNAFNFP